ncbi:hypothetical protein NHX12_032008 [Muraenolepis orangiensis]|uniref:Somatotropin n=1 Tax=Muraenolepis orangiensis TaxID=630683 RepID=A0A9Q0E5I5_9TELE|nr:hypothetical protein NHX12_032008 [Muraenolepis orangiensis]
MDSQQLFTIAVSRVQHLHMLAQRIFSEFENSLQSEEQRQVNKIFPQDFCNCDDIMSPIDKHETQSSPISEPAAELMSPYGGFYQSVDGSLRRSYELLACFKKDMHKF